MKKIIFLCFIIFSLTGCTQEEVEQNTFVDNLGNWEIVEHQLVNKEQHFKVIEGFMLSSNNEKIVLSNEEMLSYLTHRIKPIEELKDIDKRDVVEINDYEYTSKYTYDLRELTSGFVGNFIIPSSTFTTKTNYYFPFKIEEDVVFQQFVLDGDVQEQEFNYPQCSIKSSGNPQALYFVPFYEVGVKTLSDGDIKQKVQVFKLKEVLSVGDKKYLDGFYLIIEENVN